MNSENKPQKRNNRYAYCYIMFKIIAANQGYGIDNFGLAMAKKKAKDSFGIKSLKELDDEDLKKFKSHLQALVSKKTWNL